MEQKAHEPRETLEGSARNPYLFIVGAPRSGTTLLKRIIDAHPKIAITPETHWIPRYFKKRSSLMPEGRVTPELISELSGYHRFASLGIDREDLEKLIASGEPVSYSSLVTYIFDRYGEARGKPLIGDKTPSYARSLHILHTLWPRAKYVHIIRDGRDVCLSVIDWRKAGKLARRFPTWSEDPVSVAALWWEWHVRLGREAGKQLGADLYHEIRYESFLAQPAEECENLCAFLGVSYDDAMLRYHESRTKTKPGLDAKHAWLPLTPGLRDWTSQMPAEDVERFEAVAGDLLVELGYARAVPCPRSKTLRHTSKIRDSFTEDVRSRSSYPLPERW